MGHLAMGETPLEHISDNRLVRWFEQQVRVHRRTLDFWVAIYRAFDEIGPPMTVRQMFYALVIRDVVPKEERAYDQVAYHLLSMRRAGVLPFSYIADHTRWVRKSKTYSSVQAYLEASQEFYRKAVWDDIDERVEIWIEKDALAGVVVEITDAWDVPLLVMRGFPSETLLYSAAEAINASKKKTWIYYFGDYDPSGMKISDSIEHKLIGWSELARPLRVAVIEPQIRRWGLPTRPTKTRTKTGTLNTHAKDWQGDSVELDAIPADQLKAMVEEYITYHVPQGHLDAIATVEAVERETLKGLAQMVARQRK
jgi:hypothetical protein